MLADSKPRELGETYDMRNPDEGSIAVDQLVAFKIEAFDAMMI